MTKKDTIISIVAVVLFFSVIIGFVMHGESKIKNSIDVCFNEHNDCEKYMCATKIYQLSDNVEQTYFNSYILCKLNETHQEYKYKNSKYK